MMSAVDLKKKKNYEKGHLFIPQNYLWRLDFPEKERLLPCYVNDFLNVFSYFHYILTHFNCICLQSIKWCYDFIYLYLVYKEKESL